MIRKAMKTLFLALGMAVVVSALAACAESSQEPPETSPYYESFEQSQEEGQGMNGGEGTSG